MTTEEARQLANENQSKFIQWAEDWHGEHDESKCDVKYALVGLKNGDMGFSWLVEAVIDTDGDFDSFKNYLTNEK